MDGREFLKSAADYLLPPVVFNQLYKMLFLIKNAKSLSLPNGNIEYKNIHQGKRCFILCNGPSVNKQDLLPLKGEIVFSVSSGYHHKDYSIFKPRYHCTPQISYVDKVTKTLVIDWFKEMHNKIGDAELFLSHSEEKLVRENKLFTGRKVNYLCLHGDTPGKASKIIDITGIIPGISSSPTMCLMIAMYMGFKKIYLIGVEHDTFITRTYNYFFPRTLLAGIGGGMDENDEKVTTTMYEEFLVGARLWRQYLDLKAIAESNGVQIYNATSGGALDVFPRVELEKVFHEPGY